MFGSVVTYLLTNPDWSNSMSTQATPYGAPFDKPDADLRLQSSDAKLFAVHKTILSAASSFFRHFPYEISSSDDDCSAGTTPIILLPSEDAQTVAAYLKMLYYLDLPNIQDFDIIRVLEMTRKYPASAVTDRISIVILGSDIIRSDPIRYYALGCEYALPAVASLAARASLPMPLQTVVNMLARKCQPDAPGRAYGALFRYRQHCILQAASAMDDNAISEMMLPPVRWAWKTCKQCPSSLFATDEAAFVVTKWWKDYVERAQAVLKDARSVDSGLLTAAALVAPAMFQAEACAQCRKPAAVDMDDFIAQVSTKIEEKVSEVRVLHYFRPV